MSNARAFRSGFRRFVAALVLTAFLSAQWPGRALAAGGTSSPGTGSGSAGGMGAATGLAMSQDFGALGIGSEYVSGNFPGAVLMPINLWGAIGKPGIHHIPTHTDLVTFLSLAGGPTPDAQMDHIQIKRRSTGEEHIITVNADELLVKPGVPIPILEANDLIIVPRDKPPINPNTIALLSFVSGMFALVLGGFAVNYAVRHP